MRLHARLVVCHRWLSTPQRDVWRRGARHGRARFRQGRTRGNALAGAHAEHVEPRVGALADVQIDAHCANCFRKPEFMAASSGILAAPKLF